MSKIITFRVTSEEHEMLQKLAKKSGINLSEYLRKRIIESSNNELTDRENLAEILSKILDNQFNNEATIRKHQEVISTILRSSMRIQMGLYKLASDTLGQDKIDKIYKEASSEIAQYLEKILK